MSPSDHRAPTPTPTDLMPQDSEGKESLLDGPRFAPGEYLAGRFQIVRWIANGGMGEVYEAHDTELDERVALKVIRPVVTSDRKAVRRFRREISLARQVTHPNVCRIFDFFHHVPGSAEQDPKTRSVERTPSEGAIGFLTMELLVGETLSEYVPAGSKLTVEQALPIVRQMAAALDAAHAAGVVHRDFKCSNVMIVEGSGELRAVVTDFGLALGNLGDEGASHVTAAGEVIGSPAYMAPEQALGEKITPAADVYAFGVLLYRVLTGRLPFEGNSPLAQLTKRLQEDPRPPQEIVPSLDPSWAAAVSRCLARDPRDRFASMDELLAELDPALSGSTSASGSRRIDAIEPSAARPVGRRHWLAAVAAVGILGLSATTYKVWSPGKEPSGSSVATKEARTSLAVLGFDNLSKSPDVAWVSGVLAEFLTTELAASEGLRVIPRESVERLKRDFGLQQPASMAPDTLERVGQRLGNDYVLLGSYFASGDAERRLRLDLRVQSTASGTTIVTLSETATETDLLGLVERLGSALRNQLASETGIELKTDRPSMPTNPRAARLYTDGLAKLRAFDTTGARDLLLESIQADPEFPLARAALAQAYSILGFDADATDQIRLAFEHSRTAPRQERTFIEGQYREFTSDWDGAVANYQALFESFPDNLEYGLVLIRAQIEAGRPQQAEETLKSLRRLPAPLSDDPRIDDAEFAIASSSFEFDRALGAAGRALKGGRKIGARLLIARSRLHESQALLRLHRLDEAERAAQEAYLALTDLGDKSGASQALRAKGNISYLRRDLESALATFEEALTLSRESGSQSGIQANLHNKASVLDSLGRYSEAVHLREEALDIARILRVKDYIALAAGNLVISRYNFGDIDAALRLQQEALDIARQIDNPNRIAYSLTGLAWILMEIDPAAARTRLQEASELVEKHELESRRAWTLRPLGHLDLIQDDFESARDRLEQLTSLDSELESKAGRFETEIFRAVFALEDGRFDSVLEITSDLSQEWKQEGGPRNLARIRAISAKANISLGRVDAARQDLDRISELIPATMHASLDVPAGELKAGVLITEGRQQEAYDLLEAELQRARQGGRLDRLLKTRLAMGEIEWQDGDREGGFERLAAVEQEAEAAGFHLIARRAREAAQALARHTVLDQPGS